MTYDIRYTMGIDSHKHIAQGSSGNNVNSPTVIHEKTEV